MNFLDHVQRVLPYCQQYIRYHTPSAAERVEFVLPETTAYMTSGISPFEVQGLLGIEYFVLALYYVEEHFRPTDARNYAMNAEYHMGTYLERHRSSLKPEDVQNYQRWIDSAVCIRGYCAYQQDEFPETLAILGQQTANVMLVAIAGSAMARMAYESNPAYAYPAYQLLNMMDQRGVTDMLWKYEQDIFRTAYGMLTLLLDDAQRSFPDEPRIPHSVFRALELSNKIYRLLTDPQQKAWAQEDIDNYSRKLYG